MAIRRSHFRKMVLGGSLSGLLAAAGPGSTPSVDASFAGYVDGIVRDAMAADHIAGASVSIVKNGRIVYLKGFGFSRAAPVQAVDPVRTLFRVGSLTKTFTWIALMKEVERGRIRLNDPVNDYLPAGMRIPDQGYRSPIRIIDLMTHAAGFGDSELGHLIVDRPERLTTLKQYLLAHRPPRVREPGILSSYSNYGAALAGYIVARRNGVTFPALIEGEIGRPLGLSHLTLREPYPPRQGLPAPMPVALARDLSDGFSWTGADFASQPPEYLGQAAPAGVASMSAADAARYMLLLLGNGAIGGARIYSPETAAAFRQPIMPVPRGTNGWAHGFVVTTFDNGATGYGHSGATQNFLTNLIVVPSLKLGIFITTNTGTGWSLTRRFPQLVVDRLARQPQRPFRRPGSSWLVEHAADYAGLYRMTRRPYVGLESFVDTLGGLATASVSDDGYLVTNYGPLTETWVPSGTQGDFIGVSSNARIGFSLDAAGRATRFALPSGNSWAERSSFMFDPTSFYRIGGLALLVSLLVWTGQLVRPGEARAAVPAQRWSARGLLVVSALWLTAGIMFECWLPSLSGPSLMYDFPGLLLRSTSAVATLAVIGTVILCLTAPLVLMPPRTQGWRIRRRAMHLMALVPLATFSLLLAACHALEPFS